MCCAGKGMAFFKDFRLQSRILEVSMSKTYIPEGYHCPLNVYDMQCAIEFI